MLPDGCAETELCLGRPRELCRNGQIAVLAAAAAQPGVSEDSHLCCASRQIERHRIVEAGLVFFARTADKLADSAVRRDGDPKNLADFEHPAHDDMASFMDTDPFP